MHAYVLYEMTAVNPVLKSKTSMVGGARSRVLPCASATDPFSTAMLVDEPLHVFDSVGHFRLG
jgi:hypothetical protein